MVSAAGGVNLVTVGTHRLAAEFSDPALVAALILDDEIVDITELQAPPADHFIIGVNQGVNPAQVAGAHGLNPTHVYTTAFNGFAASIPPQAMAGLANNPNVSSIEPDRLVFALGQQVPTGVRRIRADLNDIAPIDGTDDRVDIDVAILDTGLDRNHPDLNIFNGMNFSSGPAWKWDDGHGHGSHVGGTVAAIDNGSGVAGVAPGARLWAAKVLTDRGSGSLSDIIAGIDWVTQNADQIEVANMSLGGTGSSASFRTAIQNSVNAGVVYVVAAGNDSRDIYGEDGQLGTSDDSFPVAYPEVAAISALTDTDGEPGGNGPSSSYGGEDRNNDGVADGADDSFAWFSNFSGSVDADNPVISPGLAIDLLMPGVDILSTWINQGYHTISGTSMAAPHAAGLAALHIAQIRRDNPGLSDYPLNAAEVYDVRQQLIDFGMSQQSLNGLAVLNDPDNMEENIGWAEAAAVVESVTVSPVSASIADGQSQQFSATANYSDGTQQDVTGTAAWASSDTVVATVDAGGLATGQSQGAATITATFDGQSGNSDLTVTAPVVESVTVSPASASVAKGQTEQFSATANYSDGTQQDVTATATWASSDALVATVDAGGLATGQNSGQATITATLDGLSGNATLTVTAVLESVTVSPASPSIAQGQTLQFTATATYSDGAQQDVTTEAGWASSNTLVATVDGGGLATGQSSGQAAITATLDGVSGDATLTVTAPVLESVTVSPAPASMAEGQTLQFTATATYSDGTQQDVTATAGWTSSNTLVATVDARGLATGQSSGQAAITATFDGFSGSAALTVTPVLESVTVSPISASIADGQSQQFGATANYSDGSQQDVTGTATWATSNTLVATVNTSGLATGQSQGQAAITATFNGLSGNADVTVTPPLVSVASITYSLHQNGRHLYVTVQLDPGLPGAGVSIDLYHNGSLYASGSGTTGTDGSLRFTANNAPNGTYTTTVTQVTADGYDWDGVTPANSYTK